MKQLLTLAAISCTTIVLTACGDDVTNVTENNVGVQSFESLKKFPDCTKDNQGEMAMSQKDGKLYYCVDSSWVQMVAESSVGANGENGSDGKDGSDGANGKDGENGKDGTSCTAIETKKGIEVSCGDKVIGTLTNGKDGKPGNDGENGVDGKNCEITDKGDGVLEIKCGDKTEKIYKAMCGLNSYDPEISF